MYTYIHIYMYMYYVYLYIYIYIYIYICSANLEGPALPVRCKLDSASGGGAEGLVAGSPAYSYPAPAPVPAPDAVVPAGWLTVSSAKDERVTVLRCG